MTGINVSRELRSRAGTSISMKASFSAQGTQHVCPLFPPQPLTCFSVFPPLLSAFCSQAPCCHLGLPMGNIYLPSSFRTSFLQAWRTATIQSSTKNPPGHRDSLCPLVFFPSILLLIPLHRNPKKCHRGGGVGGREGDKVLLHLAPDAQAAVHCRQSSGNKQAQSGPHEAAEPGLAAMSERAWHTQGKIDVSPGSRRDISKSLWPALNLGGVTFGRQTWTSPLFSFW